jgi:hypothetical protein
MESVFFFCRSLSQLILEIALRVSLREIVYDLRKFDAVSRHLSGKVHRHRHLDTLLEKFEIIWDVEICFVFLYDSVRSLLVGLKTPYRDLLRL